MESNSDFSGSLESKTRNYNQRNESIAVEYHQLSKNNKLKEKNRIGKLIYEKTCSIFNKAWKNKSK